MRSTWLQPFWMVAFLVVACAWSGACLMKPYNSPLLARIALTVGLFGSTTFIAWRVMQRQVWPRAMMAATLLSVTAANQSLTLTALNEFYHAAFWNGPPVEASTLLMGLMNKMYYLVCLLAPPSVALPWGGWLACRRTSGWVRLVQRLTITAVLVLGVFPVLLALLAASGSGLGIAALPLVIALIFVEVAAGVVAAAGTLGMSLASGDAADGAPQPDLKPLLKGAVDAFRKQPLRSIGRLMFFRLAPLLFGAALVAGAAFFGDRFLLPLRGRYLSTPYGGAGYTHDSVFYPSIIVSLLAATIVVVQIARKLRKTRWFFAGIVMGLAGVLITVVVCYILYLV